MLNGSDSAETLPFAFPFIVGSSRSKSCCYQQLLESQPPSPTVPERRELTVGLLIRINAGHRRRRLSGSSILCLYLPVKHQEAVSSFSICPLLVVLGAGWDEICNNRMMVVTQTMTTESSTDEGAIKYKIWNPGVRHSDQLDRNRKWHHSHRLSQIKVLGSRPGCIRENPTH